MSNKMYNSLSLDDTVLQNPHLQNINMYSMNKFVYMKQNFTCRSDVAKPVKVLVNPNFNKKVFINPNFTSAIGNNASSVQFPRIHINPNIQTLKLNTDECKNVNKIHVNPSILRTIPLTKCSSIVGENGNKGIITKNNEVKEANHTIISTRTKLVRSGVKPSIANKIKKRRSSIRSQFKIVKSSLLDRSITNENQIKSKYKLIKVDHVSRCSKPIINKFKVDNRSNKAAGVNFRYKKYVYINRFLSISDMARNTLLKKKKTLVMSTSTSRKKFPLYLKSTANPYKKTNISVGENVICKSKYKLTLKSTNTLSKDSPKRPKTTILRRSIIRKNTSKLRVCNIPCPYYRKFGRCRGKENGKCYKKHDPDQIALCTKFLQGACIDKKCPLSHKVSSEKMPTCKFYLEGSCSRDDCPYLHVRISPKADICKDFLEGFCKKAAECNKRHQFLCPDFEKNGICQKQRCSYPHGKMVRKYSVFNKNKFAKKSSNDCTATVKTSFKKIIQKPVNLIVAENERNVKSRYYIGQNKLDSEENNQVSSVNQKDTIHKNIDQECSMRHRPKLGKLPSFIAFETT